MTLFKVEIFSLLILPFLFQGQFLLWDDNHWRESSGLWETPFRKSTIIKDPIMKYYQKGPCTGPECHG